MSAVAWQQIKEPWSVIMREEPLSLDRLDIVKNVRQSLADITTQLFV